MRFYFYCSINNFSQIGHYCCSTYSGNNKCKPRRANINRSVLYLCIFIIQIRTLFHYKVQVLHTLRKLSQIIKFGHFYVESILIISYFIWIYSFIHINNCFHCHNKFSSCSYKFVSHRHWYIKFILISIYYRDCFI